MKLVFEDSFKKDWQKQWFKDGDIAKAVHRNGGLEVYAGDEAYNDAHHTVLWTKKEFEGNIMIEYDFTRLDSSKYYFVNILYIGQVICRPGIPFLQNALQSIIGS